MKKNGKETKNEEKKNERTIVYLKCKIKIENKLTKNVSRMKLERERDKRFLKTPEKTGQNRTEKDEVKRKRNTVEREEKRD